jgi:hypothetical protein
MTAVLRTMSVAAALALLAGSRATAADEVKDLLEKAITAQGGADVVAKDNGHTMKLKGKWYGMGEGLEYTGVFSSQRPDRLRFEINMSVMGQNITFIQGLKGDTAWMSLNGTVNDVGKEVATEHKESLHHQAVQRLVTLRDKDYKLSSLGELKVGNRPAVGIHVERKGFRDINLFFDKETHLLVKTERRVKDAMMGDQEFTEETRPTEYKKVGSVMMPHKMEIFRDGKLYVDGEVTEYTSVDKFDDTLFAKP